MRKKAPLAQATRESRTNLCRTHRPKVPSQLGAVSASLADDAFRPRLCENSSALAADVGHSSIWSICEPKFESDRTLAVVVRRSFPPRWSFHTAWTLCCLWARLLERPLSGSWYGFLPRIAASLRLSMAPASRLEFRPKPDFVRALISPRRKPQSGTLPAMRRNVHLSQRPRYVR